MTTLFYTRNNLLLFLLILSNISFAQKQVKDTVDYIHILYADHAATSDKYPGKQLLSGEVKIEHNGALLFCDKAIVDKNNNSAIAVGNVLLQQGDTLTMKAGYVKYDGNKSFAEAYEHVFLTDPEMTLQTDTLYLDRIKQESYYLSGGIIKDSINTLTSKTGKYFINDKKFRFVYNVHIDNPDYQIDSYQLDYFTESGISNFYGPTKIYNANSYIYAEKGHYDSHRKISWFVKNAFIKHKHTTIKGDSLYYDQNREYANGNNNVVVFDSLNNTWIFSQYIERWAKRDSTRAIRQPLVVSVNENDTLFIRAVRLITAGKEQNRKLWGFPKVRFFSKDFSGKSDSIYRSDSLRLMKLLVNPVIWSNKSQITGNTIILKNDTLNRMDSLMIPENVFIIQKDSAGYNQIKGKKLLGKFIDKKLKNINIYGNTEVIYYLREEDGKLTGIEKNKSSRIYIEFDNGEIGLIRFYKQPDGIIYPYKEFIKEKQQFKGFNWRGNEIIKNKNDILGNFKPVYESETRQAATGIDEQENPNRKDLEQLKNE
jgi:lipopolysaccharide export system protein LptA